MLYTPPKLLWWQPISKLLNSRRLAYALITGTALWVTWLVSISLGPGNMDLANQVIGTDYIQFYASGLTLRQGVADRLYDFSYQRQLELEIAGPALANFHANLTPPFFAWLFVPLSSLPYIWSYAVWSLLSLSGLFASLKILGVTNVWQTYLWAICWFPIFAVISFGQNSMIAVLGLTATYILWRRQHPFLAGLTASLVLFKPQLIIGLAILWLVRYRKDWQALLGLAMGTILWIGITLLLLSEAARNYVQLTIDFLPGMIYKDQFPLYHLHALRGFWALLLPGMGWLAELLSILLSLAGFGFFIRFLRTIYNRPPLCFGASIVFTIFITPHAMIYDWALLIIPAVLVWQEMPELAQYWKVIFVVLWLVTLISGPLTYLQLRVLPVAIQISIPVYLLVLIDIVTTLKRNISPEDHDGMPVSAG